MMRSSFFIKFTANIIVIKVFNLFLLLVALCRENLDYSSFEILLGINEKDFFFLFENNVLISTFVDVVNVY